MERPVLVTYATKYGSTEEVARAIAETLRESGVAVELLSARSVHSLAGYCAAVLGAPLYIGRMHGDARRFLSVNRSDLMKMPVALFVLGPVEKKEKDWVGARQQMEKELTKFPWLSPVAKEILGGKFDPTKIGFPFNMIPALRKIPASDARDWTAIRTWASELPVALHCETLSRSTS
jgi:menaquinone-dependent protoporphyrinogen oxidase